MNSNEISVDGAELRLSALRSLLGVIGKQVLGVCIEVYPKRVEMVVFVEGILSEDEKEAFDMATSEMIADFIPPFPIDPRFVENESLPLKGKCQGFWVFLRYRSWSI